MRVRPNFRLKIWDFNLRNGERSAAPLSSCNLKSSRLLNNPEKSRFEGARPHRLLKNALYGLF